MLVDTTCTFASFTPKFTTPLTASVCRDTFEAASTETNSKVFTGFCAKSGHKGPTR